MLGDQLFDAMKESSGVDLPMLRSVQQQLNLLEGVNKSVASWMSGDGSLNPNLFLQRQTLPFSLLPHEAASIDIDSSISSGSSISTVGTTNFHVPSGSYTQVVFNDLGPNSGAYAYGLEQTSNSIKLNGPPRDSVFLFCGFIDWDASSVGARELRLETASGNAVSVALAPNASSAVRLVQPFMWQRQSSGVDNEVWLQAWQNSGTSLAIVNGYLQVARIR